MTSSGCFSLCLGLLVILPTLAWAEKPELVLQLGQKSTGYFGGNLAVAVKLVLRRDGSEVDRVEVTGSKKDLPALADKIVAALSTRLKKR